MTPLRRAGARWRLLVHEWVGGKPGYGDSYHVDGAGEPIEPQAARFHWASQISHEAGRVYRTHELSLPCTEFDELVVGQWLHIEQQDTGRWWANVGGVVLLVHADRDGRPLAVSVHGPGDYADPVPGCAYDLAWTLPDTTPGETPA